MELLVSVLVGLIGAGATILAAYIQAHRSNLHSAVEMKELNREMNISISPSEDGSRNPSISLGRKTEGRQRQQDRLLIQTRPAFLDDLGSEPIDGELVLFLREGEFKAGRTDSDWHPGLIIVTTHRLICRAKPSLDDFYYLPFFTPKGFTHSAGVLVDGASLKIAKIRRQGRKSVLIEGKPFEQLLMQVKLGFFESPDKVRHVLMATIQVAAKETKTQKKGSVH